MSQLVVLTFSDTSAAGDALRALRGVEKQGGIHFEDTAVIVKDQQGTVSVDNELSSATETGMVAGAILGPMLMFMFPIAGLALGVGGGALVGRAMDAGVDTAFVKDVSAALQPGSSALFAVFRDANAAMALGALEPYQGKAQVYQTNLSSDAEENLRRALKVRTAGV